MKSSFEKSKFQFGDPIWFQQQVAAGYGWNRRHVPGTFVQAHVSRVSIVVWARDGRKIPLVVSPKNVTARAERFVMPESAK